MAPSPKKRHFFQTEMDKGSDRPIFKLKTDSVRIKTNLLFSAR